MTSASRTHVGHEASVGWRVQGPPTKPARRDRTGWLVEIGGRIVGNVTRSSPRTGRLRVSVAACAVVLFVTGYSGDDASDAARRNGKSASPAAVEARLAAAVARE